MDGDLADIFRATNGGASEFSESPGMLMDREEELDPGREYYGFGDPFPFGSMRDPFQVELDGAPGSFQQMLAATAPFQISPTTIISSSCSDLVSGFAGPMPPCNLQAHPPPTPTSPKPSSQLLDAPRVQICSPTTPIAKRRKSQSKKVVCIPAPTTAANNRQGIGEVVPSDLWAWRKYGQKPIKGSPHPRGYYRCSSSKGCSARKQVERSRTDPNMLVITYTSEHNHPWPTQRNSLAGSTRIPSKPSSVVMHKTGGSIKDEFTGTGAGFGGQHPDHRKGLNELVGPDQLLLLNDIMLDNATTTHDDIDNPIAVDYHQLDWDHDLFADLRDMEADPFSLFFDRPGGSKSMFDPLITNCNLFDWSTSNSSSTTTANRRTHQNS